MDCPSPMGCRVKCAQQGSNHQFPWGRTTRRGRGGCVVTGEALLVLPGLSRTHRCVCCWPQKPDFHKQKHYSGVKLAKALNWSMAWWADLVVERQENKQQSSAKYRTARTLEKGSGWVVCQRQHGHSLHPILSKRDLLDSYLMLPSGEWAGE